MNTLITKFLGHIIGDGFLWKTLGFIFLCLSSALAFYLKMVHDVEIQQEQIKELAYSLQESQNNSDILVQKRLDHIEQMELNKINREFYINLSYIGTFFMVVGGVILLQKFAPHILEYIWPTNNTHITVIEHMSKNTEVLSTENAFNFKKLIELLTDQNKILLEKNKELVDLVHKLLSINNNSANIGINLGRPGGSFEFQSLK
jgi:hypothetical protein